MIGRLSGKGRRTMAMGTEAKTTARKLALLLAAMALAMALAVLLAAPPAQAATFTVNSNNDAPDASLADGTCSTAANECTLRAAIEQANDLSGEDVVGFAPSVGGTITLGGTHLLISSNLKIEGPGADELSVDANSQSRIFDVHSGTVEISGLTISGGKVDDGDDSVCSEAENGGGIYNIGNLTLSDSTVSRNTSACAGGGIFNGIYNGGNLTVSNSTISDNATTGGSGGGIYDEGVTVTISDTTVTGNTARYYGGGIHSYATLTLSDTTINDNTAEYDGGGISTSHFSRGGSTSVERSTISGNEATRNGGGIYSLSASVGGDSSASKTTVANSTISANTAKEGSGGGLFNESGLTQIAHTTITDNTTPAGQGSGVASWGDQFTRTEVYSSIISANTYTDATGTDTGTDVDFVQEGTNSFVSEGYNLVGDGNATAAFDQSGDHRGVSDPKLGPLADNGGPTKTHALLSSSPARDAGDPAFAPPPHFDQRGEGYPRVRGARVDIGAFEANPLSSDLSVSKGGPAAVKPGETIEYTLGVANAGPDDAADVTLTDTLPGTTVFVSLTQTSGGRPFNCTTPAVGAGGTVTCTSASLASGAGNTFNLVVRVPEETAPGTEFTNTATVASQTSDPNLSDNEASATTLVAEPGTLGFDRAAYAADEAAGTATVTVVREDGSDGAVSVEYSTQDGTATAGSDYTATGGTLAFAPGQTSKTFSVQITDDARDETDETVGLALSNPQGGATLGARGEATLTIADDDATPPPANQAPVARGDSYAAIEDETLSAVAPGVLANDSDPEGAKLSASLASGPRHGRLTLRADGSFVYTPDRDYSGSDSFTYRASDGKARSNPATVKISVRAASEPDPRGCTIVGTSGKDTIEGTARADVICALGGNDAISGLGGNDTIYGDAGIDAIAGGAGDDRMYGGSGVDALEAKDGSGGDVADGGAGTDACSADRGDTKRNCP